MKSLLFVIAWIGFMNFTSSELWSDCSSPHAHVMLQSVVINPDPPRVGSTVSLDISGTLDKNVTGGNINATISYKIGSKWIPLPSYEFAICEQTSCPILQGSFLYSGEMTIPSMTPAGYYKGQFQASDQDGEPLLCANYMLYLSASHHKFIPKS